MAFHNENDDPIKLAMISVGDDRVDRQIADAILRGLNVKAQMRQAAALERIADALNPATGPSFCDTLYGVLNDASHNHSQRMR